MGNLQTEWIDDWKQVGRLEQEWNALLTRSRSDSIFLTWEWVKAWGEAAQPNLRPFVVGVRDAGGVLRGIAPLHVTRYRLSGLIACRTLRVMGDPHSGAEYLDWIVDAECESEARGALARALRVARGRWDCLWMPNVAGWTGVCQGLLEACQSAGFQCRSRERPFGVVDLPGDHRSYRRSLSSRMRATLTQRSKQLFQQAGATLEQCRDEQELPAYLDALFHLNRRRWAAAGQRPLFPRDGVEVNFYRNFTRAALQRGWLRLFAIKSAREFHAVQIGYVYRNTFYQLQEGFDPECLPGTGNVLRDCVVDHCLREGVNQYDFLGGFTEHKRRWRARLRLGHDVLVGNRSLKSRLIMAGHVWPTGRYLRPEPVDGAEP